MRIPIHRLVFRPIKAARPRGKWDGAFGKCYSRRRLIVLDSRGPHLARTLLHELLHLSYPGWSERRVRIEERARWKKLTWKDKARLYQAIGKGVIG